jgi:hypothetical protein
LAADARTETKVKIVVSHLTRMQYGYICVAGQELAGGRAVRPVLRGGQLGVHLLAANRGPFDIAAVVDLGRTSARKEPPQVEDEVFDPWHARQLAVMPAADFWGLISKSAHASIGAIFGPMLTTLDRRSAVCAPGTGLASLGYFAPPSPPSLYVRERPGKDSLVRMQLTDGVFDLDVSVTDIRLYGADHVTPDLQAIERASSAIRQGDEVILAVGLGRAFTPDPAKMAAAHWLQVNNIHLRPERASEAAAPGTPLGKGFRLFRGLFSASR